MKKLFLLLTAACMVLCGCEKKDSVENVNTNSQTNTTLKVYIRGIEFVDVAIQGKAYYVSLIQEGDPILESTLWTNKKLYNNDLPCYVSFGQPVSLRDKPGLISIYVSAIDAPGQLVNVQNLMFIQFYYVDILEHNKPKYFETWNENNGMRIRIYFNYL